MESSSPNPAIYWTLLIHEDWKMHVAATTEGLCYVGSHNKPFEEMADWINRRFPGRMLVQDDNKMEPYLNELIEYLQGERRSFSVPLDFRGTPFQVSVWNALGRIPYGQTLSYSDIAKDIRNPSSARAVGAAIGANPILITIPCHRVIGKNGALTGYRGGMDMKTKLLELERKGAW
ncbi:methylated-DNA--[protein]-cysteine S-methyltransferase [Paenibacillus abyssi]|uniref:methylated-DNA--[protein]-cysteine S-methyltransferase n=1 Tax=Paenibacillus abyssi TaxID=1340531 RepID=A0A917LF12_9BACL|nr:methylated-DNA--[protein]-cysteine S-methyltransferase [Paenibacillus abyssi]GGG16569.1 methylated-DNA--protein-cysteine methyltransferase, inducible [Paenibacillus abyssi]